MTGETTRASWLEVDTLDDTARGEGGFGSTGGVVALNGAVAGETAVRTLGTVKLEGKVHSWHERQLAEQAAWSAPGVTAVDDRIRVA